jgi:two-component system response regulator DctR
MQVYVIDDEEVLRDSLSFLFESRDLACQAFDSGEAFLAALPQLDHSRASCIVLDIRMEPKMSGVELFYSLADIRERWPIIFLTGHGEVSLAVNAVKQGAFDFLEKPFADNQLVDRVLEGLHQSGRRLNVVAQSEVIKQKLDSLSARELSVMEAVLDGYTNREAADSLDMAVRTVEIHRANLFKKMGVKGAVELINLLQTLEV